VNKQLDELLLKATESDNKETLSSILAIISKDNEIAGKIKAEISMIIESWQTDPFNSPNKTKFLINISQYYEENFPELRAVLPAAIKKTLPKGINKSSAIKAMGIRSDKVTLSNFYIRYHNLIELKSDRYFYNIDLKMWGFIGEIDWFTGTVFLLKMNKTPLHEVELSVVLDKILIFDPKIKIDSISTDKLKIQSSNEFLDLLQSSLYSITDKNTLKESFLYLLVPKPMDLAYFNSWWDSSESTTITDPELQKFSPVKARSVQELNEFLKNDTSYIVTENDFDKMASILSLVHSSSPTKNLVLWAETLCILSKPLDDADIQEIIPDNQDLVEIFWPQLNDEFNSLEWLNIWSLLKTGLLPTWARITQSINGPDYLKILCILLPWRAWNSITAQITIIELEKFFLESPRLTSAEALLWVWRNRTKAPMLAAKKLNHSNFFPAIARKRSGAMWQTATKELKKLLLENIEFQKYILNLNSEQITEDSIINEESNIMFFLEKLNYADSLLSSEKQSLIVKLSREFPIVKRLFSTGKVKKVQLDDSDEDSEQNKVETYITSNKSFNQKIKELNDIVMIQIPENTEAISVARAHGDLRENAEYAAAKERQKFLSERRGMIELRIASTRPTDFSDTAVADSVIVGSFINIKYKDGNKDYFYILGSWDSDPSKKYVSYETEFGKAFITKKVGDVVNLPDKTICTLENISPLPEKVLKDLK